MTLPLSGTWAVKKSAAAAAQILPVPTSQTARSTLVEIGEIPTGETQNGYVINSLGEQKEFVWRPKRQSEDGRLVGGTIGADGYSFVVTVSGAEGSRRLVGMIYKTPSAVGDDPGEGDDPGIWEAEEEEGGADG